MHIRGWIIEKKFFFLERVRENERRRKRGAFLRISNCACAEKVCVSAISSNFALNEKPCRIDNPWFPGFSDIPSRWRTPDHHSFFFFFFFSSTWMELHFFKWKLILCNYPFLFFKKIFYHFYYYFIFLFSEKTKIIFENQKTQNYQIHIYI